MIKKIAIMLSIFILSLTLASCSIGYNLSGRKFVLYEIQLEMKEKYISNEAEVRDHIERTNVISFEFVNDNECLISTGYLLQTSLTYRLLGNKVIINDALEVDICVKGNTLEMNGLFIIGAHIITDHEKCDSIKLIYKEVFV